MQFEIHKITGFKTSDIDVIVLDENFKLFYILSNHNTKHFNLPKGIYNTDNKLMQCKPFIHKLPILPKPEVRRKNVSDFDISFADNPNKATTCFDTEKIIIDTKLKNLPRFCLVWLIYHEKGHQFYKNEFKCDLYAQRQMLRNGFNYSQCKLAPMLTLTHSPDRNDKGFENILKLEN